MVPSARHAAAFVAVLLLLAQRGGADPLRDWLERAELTGDWGGRRTALRERGVDLYARYHVGFWSNLRGGLDQGTRFESLADFGGDLDLERLVGWRGARFAINWHDYRGGKPSEALVGPFGSRSVSGLEAEDAFRFFEIYLEQTLFDGRLRAKIGQLALDSDFMKTPRAALFLNSIFEDFVSDVAASDFAVYPLAAGGAFLEAAPTERERVRVGAYSADTGRDQGDNIGFDWSFSNSQGASVLVELATERRPFGLRGNYLVGLVMQTGNVEDFRDGGMADGLYAIYLGLDQTLFQGRGDGARDLGVFLHAVSAPQDHRSAFRWLTNGGFALTGPLPGRPRDVLGLAFSYMDFRRSFLRRRRAAGEPRTSSEWIFELTYRAQLAGWLTLQPDLQYVVDPNLGRRNALVLGLRTVIEF